MKIWKNTKTLDEFIDDLTITELKSEAEIALLGGKSIELNDFPNLKGIFRAGVSKNNVPIAEAKKREIRVKFPSSETIDCIYEETANFTCYLIFKMFYQNIGTLDPWTKFNRVSLLNKKLLIIGKGNIGKKVINKMQNFMKIYSWDIFDKGFKELKELIMLADCISLHIPQTKNNIKFIDAEKLSWMKDKSILINTARGPVVDEDALYSEIKKGRIKAAFDVYWKEPYYGKLKEFYPERFCMTPHVGSTCNEFLEGASNDLRLFIKELSEVDND